MSTCINTIKWLLNLLVIALVFTYVISLNVENHFVSIDSKWLSNNFLFTIAGGAFASLIVVLVCEIIRYYQIKYATEGAMFAYLANLYGQFLIIRGNCMRTLNSHDIIPDNLIQSICDNSMMLADQINGIDYIPLCRKNMIKDVLTKFKAEKWLAMKSALNNFRFLRIAIREDSKTLLQQGNRDIVTSDCLYSKGALNKIISQTSTILTYLDQIISQIDNELHNKYNWESLKQSLNAYQVSFETKTLNDYMNEDVIIF